MKPLLFTLFSDGSLLENISKKLDTNITPITLHQFPDEETYIKIDADLKNQDCVIFDSLDRPNNKLLPLIFLAETLRDLGARQVGLVAPYLSYMRQDKRFHPGEGITSKYFSNLLSNYFNWLITVDPHLHRVKSLTEIYSIPTTVVHAIDNISNWIKRHVDKPLLIGPDIESKQWVEQIANNIQVPCLILEKIRYSDHEVEISAPEIERYKTYTPILVDDIISTAKTMIETVKQLKKLNTQPPICIGIHAIFAANAYDELFKAGVSDIVTCNTIFHPSNKIDLADVILNELKHYLKWKEIP